MSTRMMVGQAKPTNTAVSQLFAPGMMLATSIKIPAAAPKLSHTSSHAPPVRRARPVSFLKAPIISLSPQIKPIAPAISPQARLGDTDAISPLQCDYGAEGAVVDDAGTAESVRVILSASSYKSWALATSPLCAARSPNLRSNSISCWRGSGATDCCGALLVAANDSFRATSVLSRCTTSLPCSLRDNNSAPNCPPENTSA